MTTNFWEQTKPERAHWRARTRSEHRISSTRHS